MLFGHGLTSNNQTKDGVLWLNQLEPQTDIDSQLTKMSGVLDGFTSGSGGLIFECFDLRHPCWKKFSETR